MRPITPARLRELTAPERQQKAASLIPDRHCIVCRSPQRGEIEGDWIRGYSLMKISENFTAFSYATILRHWSEGHPKDTLGAEWASIYASRDVLGRIQVLIAETEDIFARARMDNDGKLAVQTAAGLTRLLDVMGKVTGDIKPGDTNVNVMLNSEQAQRMVGAKNELELAEEYERRALLLRARWTEKLAFEAKQSDAFQGDSQPISDAVIVPT